MSKTSKRFHLSRPLFWSVVLIPLGLATGGATACSNGDGSSGDGDGSGGVAGIGGSVGDGDGDGDSAGGADSSGGASGDGDGDGDAGGGLSGDGDGDGSGGVSGDGDGDGDDSGGAAGDGDGDGGSGGGESTGGAGSGGSPPAECDASAAPAPGRLGLEVVFQDNDLNAFIYAAQAPGSDDWYAVEVTGQIWVYVAGVRQATPFLDVSAELQNLTPSYDERGLLSIAFAPDYEASGKFYVTLIPTTGANMDHDLLLEYARSAADPLVADTESRKALIDLEPRGDDPSAGSGVDLNLFHNGSTVKFGPDDKLYFGLGDGGGQCASAIVGAPQDVNSPYGKILRLDPNEPAPYAAAGNPFAENGDPRVWHYGVRNPFRFSFDSATGDFYYGDVGQWDFEEISYAPAGESGINFGWPTFEANSDTSCNSGIPLRDGSTHTPPLFEIPHGTDSGAGALIVAIVGGVVYRGSAIPELYGAYLFGEHYATRPMRALYQCGDTTSETATILKSCDANQPNASCFLPQGDAPLLGEIGAIVEDKNDELHLVANFNSLLKIVPVAQ